MAANPLQNLGIGTLRDFFSKVGLGQVFKPGDTDPSRVQDPYADPSVKAGQYNQQFVQKGKVFQRWTYPFRGYSMPILEVPSNRVQRYLLAFEYFSSDSLCNAAIRIKTEFALGGLDFDVILEEDEWPEWVKTDFPEWKKEYDDLAKEEDKKAKKAADDAAALAPPAAPANPNPDGQLNDDGTPKLENDYVAPTIAKGDENLPGGPRKPSPIQDQPHITDVGKSTAPAPGGALQQGQDPPQKAEIPATEVTPVRQFLSSKIKIELLKLNEKLDIPLWIIRFAQEAMIYGDGFSNIVDGMEMGDDQEDKIEQMLIKNQELEKIASQYASAYKEDAAKTMAVGQNSFGKRVMSKIGQIIVRGGSASMSVGPELLDKNREITDTSESGLEKANAGWGVAAFKEFMAVAREKEILVKGKNYTVAEIQTLNPSAVWVTRNDFGEVIKMELVKRIGVDANPLNIDDIIHWKWQGPDYMTYGMSEFFPAFRHIRLKRSLEEALAANAERYSNPIIQMMVGTDKVTRLQVPPQYMIDDAINLMSQYDRRSVLTTPYHYQLKIHGMEGKPLRLEKPLEYAVEQQISVLGIPKAFLWGDGGNFASVRAQFQTMIFRLKTMQNEAARILKTRIYNRFLKRRGMLTASGKLPAIKIKWAQHELDSEQSIIGLVNAFANLAKSLGSTEIPVSYTTLLKGLGHDYDQEIFRKASEKSKVQKLADSMKREQPPNQAPAKMPPNAMLQDLRGIRVASLAEELNQLSWTRPATGSSRRRKQ